MQLAKLQYDQKLFSKSTNKGFKMDPKMNQEAFLKGFAGRLEVKHNFGGLAFFGRAVMELSRGHFF